jgi:hypothetical protein
MRKMIPIGISISKQMIEFIDKDRKDVSRSRYLSRILEKSYAKKKETDSLESSFCGLRSSESQR